MAFSVVETKIVNPARSKNMARRNLSAKQIRAGFGGKRRKAALRARPKAHAVKHHNAPRKPSFQKKKKRNPIPEIITLALGNPARKKGTTMAKTKTFHKHHKKSAAVRSNAGRPHMKTRNDRTRKHRNPAGLGRPMDWLKGGIGVLGGVVVTRALPQAVAASYNTGGAGYAMNAGTAILAAWGTHALTKDPVLTAAVAAGGFAAVIARMISDMTSFGQYLSLTGMGDYQFSNFVTPQRIQNWKNAQFQVPQGWNGTALPPSTASLYGHDSSAQC